jgi:diguanylate cyclase (GGDEF)-like protein
MTLDYATIHLCNALLNLSYGGMLLALWFKRREVHLLYWASSLLLVSAAVYGFTLTRNSFVIPALVAAVAANISLTWAGARAFDGRPPFHWLLLMGPTATFFGHLFLASAGLKILANSFSTGVLAVTVTAAGAYFMRHGSGFARKAVGWVLIAYAPVYVASIVLDVAFPGSRLSSILILAGDFVLNNAFVVGLFAIMEEKAREQLRQLAVTDQLTGALNRAGLLAKFPSGNITDARTILLADLDHFKRINDTHGHSGGDAALKEFVVRVGGVLGKNEVIARLGGEEFGILLASTNLNDANERAEQIRDVIARQPVEWNGMSMGLTTSIGIAVSCVPESVDDVIARADEALYQAKRTGRNRVAA